MADTTERPMLMSAPMVCATLDGTKGQTRRVLKSEPVYDGRFAGGWKLAGKNGREAALCSPMIADLCPYGQPGDQLWLREAWARKPGTSDCYWYAADFADHKAAGKSMGLRWRPSIHMPRVASRISLQITGVRVERLQEISRGDAMAEGCPFPNMAKGDDPRNWYANLWDEINGCGAWALNPWVWVIDFKRIK